MNKKALFLLLPLGAAALALLAWPPDETNDKRPADPEPLAEIRVLPLRPDAVSPPPPSLLSDPVTPSPQAPVDHDAPRCVTEYWPRGDGTVFPVSNCARLAIRPGHAYESYPTQSLEALAYSDADAARILGLRLRRANEARAMSLILRASALSGGDTGPVFEYFNAYPHASEIDGVPVRKTLRMKFVLSAVAELLSDEINLTPYWEEQIRQVSSNPQKEIELLHRKAREIVDDMRQIELDVRGHSTFGGSDDA